jgi:Na+-translocating ferredoxin:NAD+ oxidoreductase subunit B
MNLSIACQGFHVMGNTAVPKKLPKSIAVINADNCTGCEACCEVCPVDCIHLIETHQRVKGSHAWCEIDMERCIGCKLCIRLPRRKTNAYELKVCPWDAIEMVPIDYLPQAVANMGGPAEYRAAEQQRLTAAAERLVARKNQQTRPS